MWRQLCEAIEPDRRLPASVGTGYMFDWPWLAPYVRIHSSFCPYWTWMTITLVFFCFRTSSRAEYPAKWIPRRLHRGGGSAHRHFKSRWDGISAWEGSQCCSRICNIDWNEKGDYISWVELIMRYPGSFTSCTGSTQPFMCVPKEQSSTATKQSIKRQ